MGNPIYESVEDWGAGVVTSANADVLPPNASPRAYNTCLSSTAGRASVQKRKGLRTMNATPISGSPAILGMAEFKRTVGASSTLYHLLISDNGRLDKLNPTTLATAAAAVSTPAPFTTGTHYPDFATANSRIYFCNGVDQKKFDGTSVDKWGITRPAAAPTNATGTAGSMTGEFETLITYYNANTGAQSSASATSTSTGALTTKKVTVSWAASADPQVTHVNVFIRDTATQAYFYRAAQVAIGTTTYAIDLTSDQLTALTIQAPSTSQCDPPPATITHCAWLYQRMFVTDGQTIFYSAFDLPDSFDPLDIVPLEGNTTITALFSYDGNLMIGTENALYALVGADNPNTWVLQEVDPKVGITSHRSVTVVEGIARWWSRQGPVAYVSGDRPKLFGLASIRPTLAPDNVNHAEFSHVTSAVDPVNERILFALAPVSRTRRSMILPYNYRLGVWESDLWESIDAGSLATVQDDDGTSWCYLGGHAGQVFRWWDAGNDGVPSGTTSGSVTGGTATTLTASAAAFLTAGGGLVERYVIAVDPAMTNIQRRRIVSNTATALTVDVDWTLNPGAGWTFVVGGIDFQLDTRWMGDLRAFTRRRFRHFFMLAGSVDAGVTLLLSLFTDHRDAVVLTTSQALGTEGEVGIWDTGIWDSARFASQSLVNARIRMARKGRAWKMRLRNYFPDQDVVIHQVAMSAEILTDKHHGT